jgi:outer membrane protein OmpA-like peptidoglycan-associated protein
MPLEAMLPVSTPPRLGSDRYNRESALARADVRDALAVHGRSARIQADGRGDTEPRASKNSEAGRASNRGVEILNTSIA